MATTVGELIRTAMRRIGVLGAGEPLSSSDGPDALRVFVQMVDGWSAEPLLNPLIVDEATGLETMQVLSAALPAGGLTEAVDLPAGYERALVFNLCIELADEWGKEVSRAVAINARDSKKLIKRNNSRTPILKVDRGITDRTNGHYNIVEGP